jgi:hypothetical protein
VSNKLVTQGYHAGAAVAGGDSARYYYLKPRKKGDGRRKELLIQIKGLLEALKS